MSDPIYNDEENAISGIGQGNRLRPALWALISFIIIKMCKAKEHGMNITTPISKQNVSLLGFVSVNDVDLVCSANNVHTPGTTIIAHLQALMIC